MYQRVWKAAFESRKGFWCSQAGGDGTKSREPEKDKKRRVPALDRRQGRIISSNNAKGASPWRKLQPRGEEGTETVSPINRKI